MFARVQQPVARMHDLESVLSGARRAVAAHARARRELRHLLRAEMEEAQHDRRLRVVADGDLQHRPIAEAALDRFHPALDLCRNARLQRTDRRQRGAVLVLPRQVQPQVLQRGQAARGQFLGDARSNAAQAGQGLLIDVDGGAAGLARHARSMTGGDGKRNRALS